MPAPFAIEDSFPNGLLAAFRDNRLRIHDRIRDLRVRLIDYPGERRSRYSHLHGGLFLTQPFQITKPDGFNLIQKYLYRVFGRPRGSARLETPPRRHGFDVSAFSRP